MDSPSPAPPGPSETPGSPRTAPHAVSSVGRFSRARILPSLELRPSGFLYDARTAESFSVNATAACIVRALQRGEPPESLWRTLCADFEISEMEARHDVLRFLGELHQIGLVSGVGEVRGDADADAADSERSEHANRTDREAGRHA